MSYLDYGRTPRLHASKTSGRGSGAELFVVEGDSAARAVLAARDAELQAVLPMQGKPLNPVRASRSKILANAFYRPLIQAVGGGFDVDVVPRHARYDRVLMLFDPDADGIHASALLLMFFGRWMRPMVEHGLVHAVRAPFATVEHPRLAGPVQAYSKEDLTGIRSRLAEAGAHDPQVRYYRGLASIDAGTLWASCLDPATRRQSAMGLGEVENATAVFG